MGRFVSASFAPLVIAMAVMFMGCGETTTSEAVDGVPGIVKTLDDLPNCSQGKFAAVYYVQDESTFYFCGYSTENPNNYGYHPIEIDTEYCTVVDIEGFSQLIECPDGTNVTVHDIACIHDETICDDTNECTDTSCDPRFGCLSAPVNCDDGNACTADSCDPATGCINEPISCDDGTVCTIDSCDPATGCANEPISCDDGLRCTIDTCDPVTGCANEPDPCDDDRLCTTDTCEEPYGCRYQHTTCELYYEYCSEDDGGVCVPRASAYCPCIKAGGGTTDFYRSYFNRCTVYETTGFAPGQGLWYSYSSTFWFDLYTLEDMYICDGNMLGYGGYRYVWTVPDLRDEDWAACHEDVNQFIEERGLTCDSR